MGILLSLQDEMKTAMKAHDQVRLDALRLMVSAIKYAEVDTPNMSDEQVVEVLKKEAKKRREAVEAFRGAAREEQAKQEEYELGIIEAYLPKMMGEDEVRKIVQNLDLKDQNFGVAMGMAMKAVGKNADGGVVAKIVKVILSK